MSIHRRQALTAIALTTLPLRVLAQSSAARVNVEGQWFDSVALVADTELLLNGVGVRAVLWFKGYAAGLYLRERAATAVQALGMPGPKRLQMRMFVEVPAAEFVKAVHKGVTRNTPAAEMPRLTDRLGQFERLITMLERVRRGDVVNLDLEPGRGLQLGVNGTPRGEPMPGEDFFAAVLRSFIGDDPYDDRLRAGLLGRPR